MFTPARLIRLLATSGLAFVLACGGAGGGPGPTPPPAPVLTGIAITPASIDLARGATSALTAIGTYSDASTATITTSVTWTSAQPAVASVGSSTGLVTGLLAGSASITASLGGVTSSAAAVTVLTPALASITVAPASVTVGVGGIGGFSATGTSSDGSTADLTSTAAWSSSDPAVATIAGGVATGVSAGISSITASLGGVTSSPASIVVTSQARSLNDTGVTASQCYQAGSDALWPCDAPLPMALSTMQDGSVGRDATLATNTDSDGKLGFSFSTVPQGCVQDNVTGLMWEVKTADAVPGLRDWIRTYSNYSAAYNPSGQYGAATDASGFVNAVNANTLCGFNDWRLPTVDELQSLVDYGSAVGPVVDTRWFPNTDQNTAYWTASPDVGVLSNGVPSNAWLVAFGSGGVMSGPARNPYHVRLVRGAAVAPPTRWPSLAPRSPTRPRG